MNKNTHSEQESGYILLYTILAASLFAVLATGILASTLRELELSEQSLEALQARFAAESATECLTYWHKGYPSWPSVLHSTGANVTIYCNTLIQTASYSKSLSGTSECVGYTGTISVGPFKTGGDACAVAEWEVTQIDLETPERCSIELRVDGFSDCSSSPRAQRSYWATL